MSTVTSSSMVKSRPRHPGLGVVACLLLVAPVPLIGCSKADFRANCQLNAWGQGNCTFTNLGKGSGSMCIVATVSNHTGMTRRSMETCSGTLGPKSTSKAEYAIPDWDALCPTQLGQNWQEVCQWATAVTHLDGEYHPDPH